MKKLIITGIAIIACIALCASVWPWSAEVKDLSAEAVKTAVTAGIKMEKEEYPPLIITVENNTSELEPVVETEPIKQTIPAETDNPEASPPVISSPKPPSSPEPTITEPKAGSKTVIDGTPYLWFPGFGWVEDEGGGSIGTKVGNPGDQLTGHKVGIME